MAVHGGDRMVTVPPSGASDGQEELESNLQSQLSSLQSRVEELELENKRLVTLIASCQCSIKEGNCIAPVVSDLRSWDSTEQGEGANKVRSTIDCEAVSHEKGNEEEIGGSKLESKERPHADLPFSNRQVKTIKSCSKRYIALKVVYFGQRYYGFASEATSEPTVEAEIFKALERTRILVGGRQESNYYRCGRTDRGVSSTGQVISLLVRSNLKGDEGNASMTDSKPEIDYVRVLNRVLPRDIRISGWSPVPTDFTARFSCLSREYKYMFWKGCFNIEKMREGAQKFVGEHDFRNFCKMDAANVRNYRRHITSFDIFYTNQRSSDDELWEMRIRGSAFLWHQVRCMVAVLFLIGEGFESPEIVDTLLDTNKIRRKPQYNMASELPLILRSCQFKDVTFSCSSDANRALIEHLKNEYHNYMLQAAIFREALDCLCSSEDGSVEFERKKRGHVPLVLRQTEPSYEERLAKLKIKLSS
ncbi:pseudouridine synthase family protein isoform X1 [Carex rostrata]